jgi:hypothetical protein
LSREENDSEGISEIFAAAPPVTESECQDLGGRGSQGTRPEHHGTRELLAVSSLPVCISAQYSLAAPVVAQVDPDAAWDAISDKPWQHF